MISNKTIFISPLDWGFGHATRCVPLIRSLLQDNTVIIGITDLNKQFFELHFPTLKKVSLPSYNIRYSNYFPVWLNILFQTKHIRAVIAAEKKLLEKIITDHHVNIVISDNRFGLHTEKAECIFMTHQLNLKAPFSYFANKINRKYIHKFSKVWVPDYENEDRRLSGQLSDSAHIKIPVEYIGPQSALSGITTNGSENKKADYLILLSGVEPQRTNLENILLQKFKNTEQKITLVRGSNKKLSAEVKNIMVIDFAFGAELKNLILNADTVICRSGYSTLMDLHVLNKSKLILIPTPGQTEQEYLAKHWHQKISALVIEQKHILNTTFTI